MASRMFGARTLFEPMLDYWWLHHWEQISVTFKDIEMIIIPENKFADVVSKMSATVSRPTVLFSLTLKVDRSDQADPVALSNPWAAVT